MAADAGRSVNRARWAEAAAVLAVVVTVILAARQLRPLAEVAAFLARTGDPLVAVPRTAWPRAIAWVLVAIAVLARWRVAALVGAWLAVLYEVVVAGLRLTGDPVYRTSLNLVVWPLLLATVAATLLTVSARARHGLDILDRRGKWLMAGAAAATTLSAMVIPFVGEVGRPLPGSADTGFVALFSVSSRLADTVAAGTIALVVLLGVAAFVGVERSVRGPVFVLLTAGALGAVAIDLGLPRPFSVWLSPVASPASQVAVVLVGVGLVLGAGLLLLRRRDAGSAADPPAPPEETVEASTSDDPRPAGPIAGRTAPGVRPSVPRWHGDGTAWNASIDVSDASIGAAPGSPPAQLSGERGYPLLEQVHAVLPVDGWTLRTDANWCYAFPRGYEFARQGWKLHLSATPLSALLVLSRCARVLVELGCAFKFAPNFARLVDLLARDADRASAGKFITVYPRREADVAQLADLLHRVTFGLPGPQILSDRQYRPGSLVHLRYGAHVDDPRLTDEGELRTPLVAPDATVVPDRREAWFTMPDWVRYPIAAAATEDEDDAGPDLRFGGRYLVHTAIQHANKGGVYQALDEREGNEVIIKQARAHVGATLSGQDSQTLLRAEAEALDLLHPHGLCPRRVDLFTAGDSLFLVEEALPGRSLTDWVTHRLTPGHRLSEALPARDVLPLAVRIVELVGKVHAAGLRIGDLTPNNLMVGPDGSVRCIDLEGAGRFGTPMAPIATHAYCAPESRRWVIEQVDPGVAGDLYACGAVLFFLATGADPSILDGDDDGRVDRLSLLFDLLTSGSAAAALCDWPSSP